MGLNDRLAEHVHLRVARATRLSRRLRKFMRLVTSHALGVPAREERGRRNDGLSSGVAGGARRNGFASRPMLMRVASGTSLRRGFAE